MGALTMERTIQHSSYFQVHMPFRRCSSNTLGLALLERLRYSQM